MCLLQKVLLLVILIRSEKQVKVSTTSATIFSVCMVRVIFKKAQFLFIRQIIKLCITIIFTFRYTHVKYIMYTNQYKPCALIN